MIAIRSIGEVRDRTGAYGWGFGVFILFVGLAYFLVIAISMPQPDQTEEAEANS